MGACECKGDAAGSEDPQKSTDETLAAEASQAVHSQVVPDAELAVPETALDSPAEKAEATIPVSSAAHSEGNAMDSAQIPATPVEPAVDSCGDPEQAVLQKFSEFRRQGKDGELVSVFADDVTWISLYSETIGGCTEVIKWLEEQRKGGRRNIQEGPFRSEPGTSKFTRDLKIIFPNGATHEVIQKISVVDGRIKQVEILPASDEHALVLSFAAARREGSTDTALQMMSENIVWKTWDGLEVVGRDKVKEILMRQISSKEVRRGIADFEQTPEAPDGGGVCFIRALEVQQPDGKTTRTTTSLLVKSIGGAHKIVEVSVQNEETLINGAWSNSSVSSDRLQGRPKRAQCSLM
eukprot:TRINITY_DN74617_c0_g1_i1.p1 TRINITY_DN74617_c0_g1~~TRINITY_DN74617_c0_g1_i1.p1  ORF type:complete len:351 (-),score=67.21 TRINITY_DN74617_c0_g1_i1:124-1176(-)